MSPKVLLVAFMAFAAPVAFILFANQDAPNESATTSKKSGHVIYFTAPG
ncbi:hypothetical protein N8550_01595 [Pirellulaceae bacterium]|jgi:hypothetical protein|nr:hypothetical protein [Pirellulaceae bacterium]